MAAAAEPHAPAGAATAAVPADRGETGPPLRARTGPPPSFPPSGGGPLTLARRGLSLPGGAFLQGCRPFHVPGDGSPPQGAPHRGECAVSTHGDTLPLRRHPSERTTPLTGPLPEERLPWPGEHPPSRDTAPPRGHRLLFWQRPPCPETSSSQGTPLPAGTLSRPEDSSPTRTLPRLPARPPGTPLNPGGRSPSKRT